MQPIQVTDRAKTVVDAADRPDLCGGIWQLAQALGGHWAEVEWPKLDAYLIRFASGAVYKRLGYLVETLDLPIPERAERLAGWQTHLTAGMRCSILAKALAAQHACAGACGITSVWRRPKEAPDDQRSRVAAACRCCGCRHHGPGSRLRAGLVPGRPLREQPQRRTWSSRAAPACESATSPTTVSQRTWISPYGMPGRSKHWPQRWSRCAPGVWIPMARTSGRPRCAWRWLTTNMGWNRTRPGVYRGPLRWAGPPRSIQLDVSRGEPLLSPS